MEFEIVPVTRYKQNCSVLWCEKTGRAAVIDPGGDVDELLSMIEVVDATLDLALVTHGHFDHCGAAAQLAERTSCRIEGPHRGDASLIAGLPEWAASHGISARSYTPDRWLEHGDKVRFGEVVLDALHCPGHCAGHVVYFSAERQVAFVGDILFRGAIGAWQGKGGNLPQLIASIRERLFPLGDDVTFVPGHGPTSTFGRERAENPFVSDAAYAEWLLRTGDAAGCTAASD